MDFSESTFVIEGAQPLSARLMVPVWGALLLTSEAQWGQYALRIDGNLQDAARNNLKVCNYGYLEVQGVTGASLEIYLYDSAGSIAIDATGKPRVSRQQWTPNQSGTLYEFEATIACPHGHGVLRIWATGRVSFQCDLKDCVTFPDWMRDIDRYKWPGTMPASSKP